MPSSALTHRLCKGQHGIMAQEHRPWGLSSPVSPNEHLQVADLQLPFYWGPGKQLIHSLLCTSTIRALPFSAFREGSSGDSSEYQLEDILPNHLSNAVPSAVS